MNRRDVSPASQSRKVQETYSRAAEFEPSVTVTEETFFGHGWQPLTITVLQAIWFLPQGAQFDVEALVGWFKVLGWKSANGKPLGADAVRRELVLIRRAGYIQARRIRGEAGRVAGIHYEVSKRPNSWSDEAGPWVPFDSGDSENRRSHHVPPMTTHGGSPDLVDGGRGRSHHVPALTADGGSPDVVDGAKQQVAPCASNGVHPPHPPEEVDTSSPNPLKHQEGAEERRFSDDELTAANRFLQMLPQPWSVGRPQAKRCAPKLLEAMADQGWPGIRQVDQDLLVAQLTKNPGGLNNHPRALEKDRIPNLPLYEAVAASVPTPRSTPQPAASADVLDEPGYTPAAAPPPVIADLLAQMRKPNV